MSKRKAPQRGDDSALSDDSNFHDVRDSQVCRAELLDRKSLALDKKRTRFSNINDLTQQGDLSQALNTQHKQQRKCKDEKQQRCGLIESISLRNFKCHAAFDHTFGLCINFILGRNGSKQKSFSFFSL